MGIVVIPVLEFVIGFYQVVSTLLVLNYYRRLSQDSARHVKVYSALVVVYFVILSVLHGFQLNGPVNIYFLYLFVFPWSIALYRLIIGVRFWKEIRKKYTVPEISDELLDS